MEKNYSENDIPNLKEVIFHTLFNQGGALTEEEIFKAFDIKSPNIREKILGEMLEDNRFINQSKYHWTTAPLPNINTDIPIEEANFIITDIETTGPAKGKDRIIDLAAIKLRGGKIVDEFETLINPEFPIPSIITHITGIKNSMVANSPQIETELPKFLTFLGNNIFVAHNLSFDYFFIAHEAYRLGLKMPSCLSLCTLRCARKLLPNVKSRGLNGLSEYYQYEIKNRHRAMQDVLATRYFFEIFIKDLFKKKIETLNQLIAFQRAGFVNKKLKRYGRKNYKRNISRK